MAIKQLFTFATQPQTIGRLIGDSFRLWWATLWGGFVPLFFLFLFVALSIQALSFGFLALTGSVPAGILIFLLFFLLYPCFIALPFIRVYQLSDHPLKGWYEAFKQMKQCYLRVLGSLILLIGLSLVFGLVMMLGGVLTAVVLGKCLAFLYGLFVIALFFYLFIKATFILPLIVLHRYSLVEAFELSLFGRLLKGRWWPSAVTVYFVPGVFIIGIIGILTLSLFEPLLKPMQEHMQTIATQINDTNALGSDSLTVHQRAMVHFSSVFDLKSAFNLKIRIVFLLEFIAQVLGMFFVVSATTVVLNDLLLRFRGTGNKQQTEIERSTAEEPSENK